MSVNKLRLAIYTEYKHTSSAFSLAKCLASRRTLIRSSSSLWISIEGSTALTFSALKAKEVS